MTDESDSTTQTRFIGRTAEIGTIVERFADPACWLLTLVGPGGIGKTSLAMEAARKMREHFRDGVYIVHCQPIPTPDLLVNAIAETLGLSVSAPHEAEKQVCTFLSGRNILLVLDNLEHLLTGVDVLSRIRRHATGTRVLATSREILNLSDEHILPLVGLSCPTDENVPAHEHYDAVRLFIVRACQARPDFSLEGNEAVIARICRAVGGMPLALELAAAWVRAASLADIAAQIGADLGFLAATKAVIDDRHSSMRAVFDASWRLLAAEEQAVFPRLSVFRGGFTAAAAADVADAPLRVLAGLIDRSLVQFDGVRYTLHELLRQYASERLDEADGAREAIADRHAGYYAALLFSVRETIHFGGPRDLVSDLENIRAAWQHAARVGDLDAIRRAAPSLHWLLHFQGRHDEGAALFLLAETAAAAQLPASGHMLGALMLYRSFFQPDDAFSARLPPVDVDKALALWESTDTLPDTALPLSRLIFALMNRLSAPQQIISVAQKCLDVATARGDLAGTAIAVSCLGMMDYHVSGDIDGARRLIEQALAIDRQIGFHLNARACEAVLGEIAAIQGRYAEASAHFDACIGHHRAVGVSRLLDVHQFSAGLAALHSGNLDNAQAHFDECRRVATAIGRRKGIVLADVGSGLVAAARGDNTIAEAYYEACQSGLRAEDIGSLSFGGEIERVALLALILGQYGQALKYCEATIAETAGKGYRTPALVPHARAGLALVGLRDEPRALPHLLHAYSEARTLGLQGVLLEIVPGLCQFAAVPVSLSAQILAIVKDHPASSFLTRIEADRLLESRARQSAPPESVSWSHSVPPLADIEMFDALVAILTSETGGNPVTSANSRLIESLSPRELEVLDHIAEGCTNQEIADQLFVGVSTVKKHINHIYDKLDVKTRTQAVARARLLGLLP